MFPLKSENNKSAKKAIGAWEYREGWDPVCAVLYAFYELLHCMIRGLWVQVPAMVSYQNADVINFNLPIISFFPTPLISWRFGTKRKPAGDITEPPSTSVYDHTEKSKNKESLSRIHISLLIISSVLWVCLPCVQTPLDHTSTHTSSHLWMWPVSVIIMSSCLCLAEAC